MVDIHQSGDYPILLGDSLKDDATTSSHISFRYNWIPRSGLTDNKGKIKTTPNGLSLAYDRNGEALKYTGWLAERSDADQNPELALFYDPSKSAFVVEKLAATLDFNLHSGTNITPDHINRHSQIVKPGTSTDSQNPNRAPFDEDGDDSPDGDNPFDYRHFLNEAKEAAEKASLAGNRTPLPGGHTPMSGLSSPMGGSHLLQSNSPQFGRVEIIDASHIEDGPEWGDRRHHFKSANKNKTVHKTKATITTTTTTTRTKPKVSSTGKSSQFQQPKPLSNERVQSSDSDSDFDGQPVPITAPKPKQTKRTPPKKKSQPPTRSPAIIVDNDSDSGGLEIQPNSPPTSSRKRGYKIDTDAFRSQSGTPAITRPVSSQSNAGMDTDMPDADADADADADINEEYNKFLASDSDEDMDTTRHANADVDDLILDDGSTSSPEPAPAPPTAPTPSRIPLSKSTPASAPASAPPRTSPPSTIQAPIAQRAKRRQSSTISRTSRASRVSTRTSTLNKARSPSPMGDDSDDDGGLAKELEEALLREEYGYGEEDEEGVGLGIVGGGVDEESDISEEE